MREIHIPFAFGNKFLQLTKYVENPFSNEKAIPLNDHPYKTLTWPFNHKVFGKVVSRLSPRGIFHAIPAILHQEGFLGFSRIAICNSPSLYQKFIR